MEDVSPLSLHPWHQSFVADADASEVHVHLVSQWPMHLPVPVPSHDLLLSSYEVYASCVNDLVILILSAPAYIANPTSVPTCTTPLKFQASLVVSRYVDLNSTGFNPAFKYSTNVVSPKSV